MPPLSHSGINRPDSTELFYRLVLNQIPEVGPVSFVRLLKYFGSAKIIFQSRLKDLRFVQGIRQGIIEAVGAFKDFISVEEDFKAIERLGIKIVHYDDAGYPERLRQISCFPPLIFVLGQIDCLQGVEWLGVVGSRLATDYGIMACRKLVSDLVRSGLGIVSGFARGIDITAHETALVNGGRTVAVVAGGLSRIHPTSHRRYVEKVAASGAVISEFSMRALPLPQFFPRRNRIISGLSRGVLIVEADLKSGAMITAQYALDQNRDLFCVPGPIFSNQSRGCLALAKEGAKLISEARDILDDWKYVVRTAEKPSFSDPGEEAVYEVCLGSDRTPDAIIDRTHLSSERVTVLLTKLELQGRLKALPGRRYVSV